MFTSRFSTMGRSTRNDGNPVPILETWDPSRIQFVHCNSTSANIRVCRFGRDDADGVESGEYIAQDDDVGCDAADASEGEHSDTTYPAGTDPAEGADHEGC